MGEKKEGERERTPNLLASGTGRYTEIVKIGMGKECCTCKNALHITFPPFYTEHFQRSNWKEFYSE